MQRQKNSVVKGGDYVALVINYEADYGTVIEKASKLLGISSSSCCCLVHTTGTRIVDGQMNGGMRWCIGRYLESFYARTTSVRLGLLVDDEDENEEVCSKNCLPCV